MRKSGNAACQKSTVMRLRHVIVLEARYPTGVSVVCVAHWLNSPNLARKSLESLAKLRI